MHVPPAPRPAPCCVPPPTCFQPSGPPIMGGLAPARPLGMDIASLAQPPPRSPSSPALAPAARRAARAPAAAAGPAMPPGAGMPAGPAPPPSALAAAACCASSAAWYSSSSGSGKLHLACTPRIARAAASYARAASSAVSNVPSHLQARAQSREMQ